MGTAEERAAAPGLERAVGWEIWVSSASTGVLSTFIPLQMLLQSQSLPPLMVSWRSTEWMQQQGPASLGQVQQDGGNVNFQSNSHWCWLRYDWGWGQKGQDLYRLYTLWHTGVLRHNSKPDCLSPSEETHLVKFLLSEDLTLEAWIKEFEALCQIFDLGWKDITTTRDKDPAGHHSVSLS